MTDLLQSAVLTGTGRAAQIGRPVAGKTGTTSSNKDGWFIGFSSGLTTGVWMGRDDARAIAGLQGGTAPARAFHDFMAVAVANRPVENFQTEVPMPDWNLDTEEDNFGLGNELGSEPLVDEYGNPRPGQPVDTIPVPGQQLPQQPQGPQQQQQTTEQLDQQWLDQVLPPGSARRQPGPQPQPQRPQVVRPPTPTSPRPSDPLQPAPNTPQQ
jgi:penicillin-binding protein 1A